MINADAGELGISCY